MLQRVRWRTLHKTGKRTENTVPSLGLQVLEKGPGKNTFRTEWNVPTGPSDPPDLAITQVQEN